jgi:hypothetical protein
MMIIDYPDADGNRYRVNEYDEAMPTNGAIPDGVCYVYVLDEGCKNQLLELI